MQKFKTSSTPTEISYHQIVQGFINPLKCTNQSINRFSIDYIICWSTAHMRLRAVALRAICDGRSAEKFWQACTRKIRRTKKIAQRDTARSRVRAVHQQIT